MPPVRPTLLVATLALLSCGPTQRRASSPSPGGDAPLPVVGVEAPPRPVAVDGWRGWTKVNARRFRSKGHGYVWVDVFVDRAHAAAYADRKQPAPEGFAVVMAGYDSADGNDPTGLTVMAKMPPGYDAANGDWYYAVYDPDGKSVTLGGKLPPCAGCHVQARTRDFLYGVVADDTP